MSDPSIALLFDDTALVAQLREALGACGGRIVHEGSIAGVSRDLLRELDADVLVINLDDAAAEALDRLYALIDGERPRLVFNDAAASAALVGWDRARWARHLAAKVMQSGEVDPPRPSPPRAQGVDGPPAPALDGEQPEIGLLPRAADAADADQAERNRSDIEALSAELEALLASAELSDSEADGTIDDAGLPAPDGAASTHASPLAAVASGLALDERADDRNAADAQAAEIPDLAIEPAAAALPGMDLDDMFDHPGTGDDDMKEFPESPAESMAISLPVMGLDDLLDRRGAQEEPAAAPPAPPTKPAAAPPALGLDGVLGGMRLVDDAMPGAQAPGADTVAVDTPPPAPVLPSIPDDWALVDDDALVPATFGVEKQSAAEFLAPEADAMAVDDEPVLNLELVSMEEAVAPRPAPAAVEMHLDELQVALSRLVVTGSTLGGSVSALAFYAALPADATMTFLHAQHLRGQSVAELVAQLAAACPLPVALAADGVPTRPGQVLVAPPGYAVRIHRDARVDMQSMGEEQPEVSIDDCFSKAAEVFGRDALAIVFSGHNTDSIAGAKAVHAAGGRVWVETAANEYADMVHEISAADVVEYFGTPQELAARLAERPA